MKKTYLSALLFATCLTIQPVGTQNGIFAAPTSSTTLSHTATEISNPVTSPTESAGDFRTFQAIIQQIQQSPDEIAQIPDELIRTERVRTASSPDGKLHIFSFNLFAPGTIQQYQNIIQYKEKGKVYTFFGSIDRMAANDQNAAELNDGSNIEQIHQVKLPSGKSLYLLFDRGKISYDNVCCSVFGYIFKDGKPEESNCFMLEANDPSIPVDELKQSHLSVCYSAHALADFDHSPEADSRILCVDPEGLKIYQTEIDDYRPTGRYIVFQFDGKHFVRTGKDGGYWLHPSVRCYKSTELNVRTSKFQIRIDCLNDGSVRYACWKADALQSSRPDLILYNGKKDFSTNLIYQFRSGSVAYHIYDTEGYRFLRVYQGEKLLVEQEIE